MRDSSSNTGPNPSSMTLSRRLHIWTPMCDFGISVPPWASAAVTGPARVAAPTATVEPASPRRNTRRSMLLLPMVVSSGGGRRQGRDADVPEADRVLRAVVLQADEPAQPVPSGGRDVLVDEHAVAEDGVVPAGHPDLQVGPGAAPPRRPRRARGGRTLRCRRARLLARRHATAASARSSGTPARGTRAGPAHRRW